MCSGLFQATTSRKQPLSLCILGGRLQEVRFDCIKITLYNNKAP